MHKYKPSSQYCHHGLERAKHFNRSEPQIHTEWPGGMHKCLDESGAAMHLCISVCTPAGLRALTRTQSPWHTSGILFGGTLAMFWLRLDRSFPSLILLRLVLCNLLHRSKISPQPSAWDNELTEAFDKL